jgi:PadR family transcriptional regulator, regulatory protein PadR
MRAELLKGHLDLLLLSVLAAEPLHGYAVIEELRRRGGFELPEGTVYPALHRLEAGGLVTSRWSRDSGRRRRVYSVTRTGRRELARRREEWRTFTGAVGAVVV